MPTSRTPSVISRREVLQQATAFIAGAAASAGLLEAQQPDAQTTRFFPGFKPFKADGAGAVINGVIGGQGPPILLLHGAPQTHVVWVAFRRAAAGRKPHCRGDRPARLWR